MVDKAVQAYKHAVDKARSTLQDARAQVEEMKTHVKDMAGKAREKPTGRWPARSFPAGWAAPPRPLPRVSAHRTTAPTRFDFQL